MAWGTMRTMQTNTTSALRTIVRNWWATPGPSFQLRQASERWGRFGSGKKRRTLRIVEVIQETPTTSTFVLEPLDREPIEYLPGQHLTLLIEIDGVAYRRCYSFSSSPGASERPAITVKHVPDGRVSGFLTRNLGKAQTIRAAEPAGTFTVAVDPEASRHYVMIAGGVGITPLISMTEAILRREPKSRVTLLFGNRSEDEIIFRTRLASLAAEFPNALELVLCLDEAPAGWQGITGQLGGGKVLELLGQGERGIPGATRSGAAGIPTAIGGAQPRSGEHRTGPMRQHEEDATYLVCGPGKMMESVTAALAGAGVPNERIRLERFEYVAPSASADRPSGTCFTVIAGRSVAPGDDENE